jgi:RNA polymerase sigma-70 factor (ECF subfamily)
MSGELTDPGVPEDERLTHDLLENMPGLRLQLARVTRDYELAADLLQDAVVTALQKVRAGELPDRTYLDGYVYRVALNHLRNYRRKNKSHVSDPEGTTELADTESQGLPESFGAAQCARVARKLLSGIGSTRDRELLVRFYLDEESKESLCKQFGLTDAHFNRVIFRARERFRDLLQQQGFRKSDFLSTVFILLLANGVWRS